MKNKSNSHYHWDFKLAIVKIKSNEKYIFNEILLWQSNREWNCRLIMALNKSDVFEEKN